MRRLLFVLAFLATLHSLGQKAFTGGIVAGPVTTQISGDGLAGWNKFGFAAGPWINMPISDRSGIFMAMKYIMKGSRTKIDTITFQSFGYYLNYIDVPILYTHRFAKKNNLMFSVGPYAGYLLNQKIRYNGNGEAAVIPAFEKYDIGISGGIAWWATSKLFFEYSLSTSVLPTRPAPLVVNPNSYYERGNYNQTMQIMIGIRFGKSEAPR
jgi:hypothetical protein